jgi:hypothetical protein
LVADEGLEMGAQGNAGGHNDSLTVNNYYYLTTNRLCQEWQDALFVPDRRLFTGHSERAR